MAQLFDFPDCCGLKVIARFKGGHPGANPEDCQTPEATNRYLKEKEQEYYDKIAGLMAVLSEPQNLRIGNVFINRKWDLLKVINNARTRTKLYVYVRDLNRTAARQRRIFGAK